MFSLGATPPSKMESMDTFPKENQKKLGYFSYEEREKKLGHFSYEEPEKIGTLFL